MAAILTCLVLGISAVGPSSASLIVGTFTGADSGEGLDLHGNFFAAVNLNASSSPILVGDASFIDIDASDTVSRSGLISPYATNHAGYPNYGASENDLALSAVMRTSRFRVGTITVSDLIVDTPYKLQILFQTPSDTANRNFDITLSGASSGFLDEFNMRTEGSFYNSGGKSRGVVVSQEFLALTSQLSIEFAAGSSGDTLPLVNALTVEYFTSLYWTGNTSGSWGTVDNWSSNPEGTWAVVTPASRYDLFFTASTASNLSTTLGADFTVNTISITDPGVSIAAGNTLTANATSAQAFLVSADSGATTIAANLAGANAGLTKSGNGLLTLSGANTYGGATTITSGTVLIDGADALPASGPISVSTGGTLSLADGTTRNSTLAGGLTLDGGSFVFDINSTASDTLAFGGAASLSGTNVVKLNLSNATASTWTLMTAASGLDGGTWSLDMGSFTPSGLIWSLSSNATALTLTATVATNIYYWTGNTSASWGTADNWSSDSAGSTPRGVAPGAGNDIYFAATGASNLSTTLGQDFTVNSLLIADPGVTIGAGHTLTANETSAQAFNITADSGTTTLAANLAGAGAGLRKSGNGSLTLSGTNTYGDATSIVGGTLTISGGAAIADTGAVILSNAAGAVFSVSSSETIGSLQGGGGTGGVVTIASGQTLTVAETGTNTFSGVVEGAGGLVKSGAGTLQLTGENTYSGTTTISAGTLQIGNGGSSGSIASTSGIINNGVLEFNRSGNIAVSNTISGNGAVILGTGTLQIGNGGTTGSITSTGGITNNGSLQFNRSDSIDVSQSIVGSGTVSQLGSGTLVLSGSNSYSGPTTLAAGTLQLNNANAIGTTGNITFTGGTLVFTANNTADISSRIVSSSSAIRIDTNGQDVTFASALASTNAGGLEKYGSGTLALSGTATAYSGATTINAGTLSLNLNSISPAFASPIIVNAGATLRFSPTASSRITSAAATVNLQGAMAYNTTGNFWQIINGAVTATAPSTIDLNGTSNAGFYLDGGLHGSADVTVTSNTNSLGLVFRTANSTYSGNLTVNGNASTTANLASGLMIGNTGTSLSSANLAIMGTLELGDASNGMGWAASGVPDTTASINALNGTGVVVGNMRTAASSRTLSVGNNDGSGDFSGVIANGSNNTLNFTKAGAGTQTLSGNNTFTGTTTILAGTLQISGNGLLGGGNYSATISNNGTLIMGSDSNQILGGAISGSGVLTKNGAGTTTLLRANTYSGGTTLNTGTLVIGNTSGAGSGTITQTDGTSLLKFDTTGTVANALSIYNVASNQTLTLSGNITAQNTTYDVASGTTLSINGTISGSGGVTKIGDGTLELNAANTFNGTTVVNTGTLKANATGALANTTNITVTGGSLLVTADNAIGDTVGIDLAGGTLAFGGNVSDSIGALTLSANSVIDLGEGDVVAIFADLFMGNYTLAVHNWSGTTFWDGGRGNNPDQIYFSRNLSGGELDRISFYSDFGSSFLGTGFQLGLGSGFQYQVIPVPEAETWVAAALLLAGAGVAWMRGRRRQRGNMDLQEGESGVGGGGAAMR